MPEFNERAGQEQPTAGWAKALASGFADQNLSLLANKIDAASAGLAAAADRLAQKDEGALADALRRTGEMAERLATSTRDQSLDQMLGHVNEFARRRPAMFLGLSAIAGVALGRFMRSSGRRRPEFRGDGGYELGTERQQQREPWSQ